MYIAEYLRNDFIGIQYTNPFTRYGIARFI